MSIFKHGDNNIDFRYLDEQQKYIWNRAIQECLEICKKRDTLESLLLYSRIKRLIK